MALEKLAREMKYSCTYSQFGCKEVFAHDKLDERQAKCRYGLLTRPATRCDARIQCDWIGNYNEVKNRLIKSHLECISITGK